MKNEPNLFEEKEVGIFTLVYQGEYLYIGIYKKPFQEFLDFLAVILKSEDAEEIPAFIREMTEEER